MKTLLYTCILCTLTLHLSAQKVTIKDDVDNILMEINDEGTRGSITLPSYIFSPLITTNKLYNTNSQLFWNGVKLGTATEAGGWKLNGLNLYPVNLSSNVGIGTAAPALPLHVIGDMRLQEPANPLLRFYIDNTYHGYVGVINSDVHLSNTLNGKLFLKTQNAARLTVDGLGNVGIGTTSPGQKLDVTGGLRIGNSTSGTAGTIRYNSTSKKFEGHDGSDWGSFGGGTSQLNDLTDAKTGGNSVFLGSDSGAGDDASDNRNSALGAAALYSNTSGIYNSGIGYRSLYSNVSGDYNMGYGAFADYRNQGGSRNVMIGYQAGASNSNHSKSGNIHIGYFAGYNDTTDNKLYIENSNSSSPLIWGDFDADSVRINGDLVVTGSLKGMMGIDDLQDGIAAGKSVYLGEEAGSNDDGTDNKNTALGYHALRDGTTGTANVAIGHQAAQEMTTGNYNIAIGNSADGNNIGGEKNVMIGYAAGFDFTAHSKSGNVMIGYTAGYGNTTDNKLYIENSQSSTPLIWGDFEKDSVVINGDFGITGEWTGIGIDDLSDGKKVGDCIYLGDGAGGNSFSGSFDYNVAVGDSALYSNDPSLCVAIGYKALFSNAGDYNTAVGFMALADNTDRDNNTAVGYRALRYSTTGSNNTAIGSESLMDNTTGDYNTAIGHNSLFNNTEGNNNTATGDRSLYSNTTGIRNTASGQNSMYYNTTGSYNSAFGNNSLFENQGSSNSGFGLESLMRNDTGTHNTAIGYFSLRENTFGNYNTSSGSKALYFNKTGSGNTANGYSSLKNNTEGSNNAALGHWSLSANTTGYQNNAFGAYTLHSNTTGYSNAAFGYEALKGNTIGDQNIAMGDLAMYSNTDGDRNVAIGTYALEDNDGGNRNTAIGYWAMNNNVDGDYNTAVGEDSGPSFGNGNLTNTTALGATASISASNNIAIGNTSVTWIGGQVSWSTFSDARMKENIMEDVKGLDFIMKLRPVTYHVKKDMIDRILGARDKSDYPEKYDIEKIKQTGFLAQEVEHAAIRAGYDFSGVRTPENENTPYSLSYAQFVVPLVKAVQEQQEDIEELSKQVNRFAEQEESSTDSQDIMKVCNGNVITNNTGYVEVHLPDDFDGIYDDYRYQLTVIGDFAQAIISKEINGNQFEIRTDRPNVKVSWQVTGVR